MDFTGERYVPGYQGLEELYVEHMSRYVFASGLARDQRVLDLGCGCGYGAHFLALSGALHVLGIDNSEDAIAYARCEYKHTDLSFAVMDAHMLALSAAIDLVTCFEMIEHVEDAPRMLAEVGRILDQAGLLIVSTPNKATYVAGGEGGKNPFHTREFDLDEFTRLLTAEFRSVRVFGQFWTEGMALSPHADHLAGDSLHTVRLPEEYSGITMSGLPREAPYFVAVCGQQDVSEAVWPCLIPAVTHRLETRYDRLKRCMKKLEEEFDKRGRWARGLDKEIQEKHDTIRHLQAELENLRGEFDKRGLWAKELDEKVMLLEGRNRELTADNTRLRHALAGAGQRT